MKSLFCSTLMPLLLSAPAWAAATAEEVIHEYERKTQQAAPNPRATGLITAISAGELGVVFDKDYSWYLLRYPIWPIAFNISKPLGTNNIFVLDKANKVKALITTEQQAEKFARENMKPITSSDQGKTAAAAWIVLQQQLQQDGMFRFLPTKTSSNKTDKGLVATGSSAVDPAGGNDGSISATLTFDDCGKLNRVETKAALQAGMRPICQSTKLLHPDPIVRKMAERDLLVMGKACGFYLKQQRAKASPKLRAEIDRVWRQIQLENRDR